MLLLTVILLAWIVAAAAAIVLCVAARRGDEGLAAVRPTVLRSIDGGAVRRTRAG